MAKEVSEKELRSRGYLTIEEFLNTLIPGLKDYMLNNWGVNSKDSLYHPEDLVSNASVYLDVALHVIGDFGVNENNVKK